MTTMATNIAPKQENINIDFHAIMVVFLPVLIFLLVVSCCPWIRRISGIDIFGRTDTNQGINKNVLITLPKLTYDTETMADKLSDCAICLTEFVDGDEIKMLPPCGHGFHVTCIDRWLGSHSTCPCCRSLVGEPEV